MEFPSLPVERPVHCILKQGSGFGVQLTRDLKSLRRPIRAAPGDSQEAVRHSPNTPVRTHRRATRLAIAPAGGSHTYLGRLSPGIVARRLLVGSNQIV